MKNYSLTHLSDGALLSRLSVLAVSDRGMTAELLAHIAEVDARKLYVPAAHPSMFSYCVHELKLSEQAALKRICVARVARRFPVIFDAIADGSLNLSTMMLLATHLTEATAAELLAAAAHKSKSEVEQLLAKRFPKADVPARIESICAPPRIESICAPPTLPMESSGPGAMSELSPGIVEAAHSPSQIAPLAPERFALKLTIDQETHDQLRYAQSLLGRLSTSDLPEVIARAIHELVSKLEKQKFAKTDRPRKGARRSSDNPRHIPARVKRAVVERDQGRCTFVSEAGKRCPCESRVEFDHVEAIACGGESTVANLRLRCRAHNQHAAEQAFGAEFMANKRLEALRMSAKARDLAAERAAAAASTAAAAERAKEQDVMPWLRALRIRAADAREAAKLCEDIPDAPIEERVRRALTYFHGRARKIAVAS